MRGASVALFAGGHQWDALRRRGDCKRGLWAVLLGPDGAGKSSVIAGIGDGVAAGFTGCDSYHLQPLNWRSRRSVSVNSDPHGQTERGALVTALKLGYLLILNWLGYLAVVRPRVKRGMLVSFDRYFPDYVVDSKRYRVPSSCQWLVDLVAGLIPQPDLYVVLDAPSHVLHGRKQELTPMEMERQRKEYRRLAVKLGNAEIVSADQPLAAVLERVMQCVIERHLVCQRKFLEAA